MLNQSQRLRARIGEAEYVVAEPQDFQTALSIYTLHRIARDLLNSAIRFRKDFRHQEFFDSALGPINSFDWNAKTSPLSALGGMKGVSKAYDLVSEVIGQKKYVASLEKPLRAFSAKPNTKNA